MQMNLLGTHDTERIITTLGGDSGEGVANCILAEKRMTVWQRELGAMRLKLAYSIIAALPGIPCVYYGDEIGLEGYSDPFNRRPFPWGKEDSDILDFYKKIGSIRAGNSVLSKGDFELILLTDDCLIFKRSKNGKVFLCVVNNSDVELSVKFDKRVECEISKRRINEVILKPYTSELIKTTDSNIFVLKNPGEPT
jgi:glycosidase